MMKTIALIFGLMTMGLTTHAYADFFHLGAGGCRTPTGGHGTYTVAHNVSWSECRTECISTPNCKAVEYGIHYNGISNCEVHTSPINHTSGYQYNRQRSVSCWGYTP